MSDKETVIVAHQGEQMRRAFKTWGRAREWRDAVRGGPSAPVQYTLTEVLVVE